MVRPLRRDYGGAALITGASSGIGRAMAERLAQAGVDLYLVARRMDRLEALTRQLEQAYGVRCQPIPCDLAAPGAVGEVLAALDGAPIGMLVNNAGFGFAGPFATRDLERLEGLVQVNCTVPLQLTRALLPGMLDRGRGAIIFVASIGGRIPMPYEAAYAASKAFDLMLGESLHAELLGTGIDVVTVCPGPTQTEFLTAQGFEEDHADRLFALAAKPTRIANLAIKHLGRRAVVAPFWTGRVPLALVQCLPRWVVQPLAQRGFRRAGYSDR